MKREGTGGVRVEVGWGGERVRMEKVRGGGEKRGWGGEKKEIGVRGGDERGLVIGVGGWGGGRKERGEGGGGGWTVK